MSPTGPAGIMESIAAEQEPGIESRAFRISDDRRWVPILVNRTAGPRPRSSHVDVLLETLRRDRLDPEVFTQRTDFQAAIADPEKQAAVRCVVAGGGDGTVRWMINAERRFPIAVFPLGSENLLAKYLGIRRDGKQMAEIIRAGFARQFDLGRINDLYFSLMASAGFDADVVERVHARRNGHVTKLNYAWHIADSIVRFPFFPMTVTDDSGFTCEGYQIVVFNLPQYALGLPICPEANAEDQWLHLLVFQKRGTYHLLRFLSAVAAGWHRELPGVVYRKVQRIRVDSAEMAPIQCDGDPAGRLPAVIEVVPSAMTVLTPPVANQV